MSAHRVCCCGGQTGCCDDDCALIRISGLTPCDICVESYAWYNGSQVPIWFRLKAVPAAVEIIALFADGTWPQGFIGPFLGGQVQVEVFWDDDCEEGTGETYDVPWLWATSRCINGVWHLALQLTGQWITANQGTNNGASIQLTGTLFYAALSSGGTGSCIGKSGTDSGTCGQTQSMGGTTLPQNVAIGGSMSVLECEEQTPEDRCWYTFYASYNCGGTGEEGTWQQTPTRGWPEVSCGTHPFPGEPEGVWVAIGYDSTFDQCNWRMTIHGEPCEDFTDCAGIGEPELPTGPGTCSCSVPCPEGNPDLVAVLDVDELAVCSGCGSAAVAIDQCTDLLLRRISECTYQVEHHYCKVGEDQLLTAWLDWDGDSGWRLTIYCTKSGAFGFLLVWEGWHVGDSPIGTYSRTGGCDTTATVTVS